MADGEPTGPSAPSRHRPAAGYFVAALLVAATIAAVVVALTGGGDEPSTSSASSDPFAPRYDGLEDRRTAAGVPTMAVGGGEHFHPEIEVYVRGEQIDVPANIGIDPAQPPATMAGLHTHDTSGTIHNEAGTGSTLGQFFEIWGVPLSSTELGPHEANGKEDVRIWVDGEPSQAYGDLELADRQRIVVAYGTADQVPAGLAP